MHVHSPSRRCLRFVAAALLPLALALALPACKGLSPDAYKISPAASSYAGGTTYGRQRRIYFTDEPAPVVEERRSTSSFRPQDVPARWLKSNMAVPMRLAPILP